MLAANPGSDMDAFLLQTGGTLKFEVRPFVGILDPASSEGIDFNDGSLARCVRFTITASVDNPCIGASLTFVTGPEADSLSPLIDGSSLTLGGGPVLAPGRRLFLTANCRADIGMIDPLLGNYAIFSGRIDRVSVGKNGDEVTVTCRDESADLLNRTIEQATKYGTEAGQDVEEVIGAIMDAWGSNAANLAAAASPGFAIYEYAQQEMPTLLALRQITQQFGWDIRWFPRGPQSTGNRQALILYDPDRERTLVDLTLGKDRYTSIEELAWGDEDVRNVWDVYWQDANGVVQPVVTVQDLDSIDQYGRRYARIYLQRAENIRSEASATAFANAALADTKDPFASHVIKAPFLPMVELNDLHLYQANGVHYDEDQRFAVVSYTHEYANGHADTTIGARGKPLAAYREYRRSVPPKTIVSTSPPSDDVYAPEGTIHIQTDSLAFPA